MNRRIAGLVSAFAALAIMLLCRDAIPPVLAAGPGPAGPSDPAAIDCSQEEVTNIPAADCNALVALFTATSGPGWTNQAGWLQAPVCTGIQGNWYGVRCDCSTA
jgi:hypothetical protein